MFQEYHKAGLCVIPEKDKKVDGKWKRYPLVKWAKYNKTEKKPTHEEVKEWDSWKGVSYGLLCGKVSGVIGIDIDIDISDEKLADLELLLGEPLTRKFGTKGITLFYSYKGEKHERIGDVEIKSDGGKVTIPPSLIPKYKESKNERYVWKGSPLHEVCSSKAYIAENYKNIIESFFNIPPKVEPEYKIKPHTGYYDSPTEEEIERALDYISPTCSYDEWKMIGACLYNELQDAGFYYFDNWSSKGANYNQAEMRTAWNGCKTYTRYTIGSLFYKAKEFGYTPNERDFEPVNERALARKQIEEEKSANSDLPDFYKEAPLHVKAIADWISGSAYIPQPVLSLGVACGLIGFVMKGMYKFSGVKSNMYCINIARTATGKEHILQCANGLFEALGLKGTNTGARFTSDTAIIQGLKRTKGTLCYVADEVQTLLRACSNPNKNSPEAKAEGILLSAYTGAEVSGMEYADKKQTEEKGGVIKNPFLSVLGFTTPYSFYSSIGQAQKGSGLVGRLTVFEGLKVLPEEPNENYDGDAPKNPPVNVVRYLQGILDNIYTDFSYDGSKMLIEKPIIVEAEPEVMQSLKELQKEIFRERNELYFLGDDDSENALLRKTEMIKKYCLIASGGNKITMADYNWAVKMADYNSGIMLKAVGEFGSYELANKVQKLYEYIEMRGRVTKSQITNGLRIFRDNDEREKAIRELLETEKIRPINIKMKDSQKKSKGFELVE